MSKKIVSLRGTSGSGKSTVAFTMLKNFPSDKIVGEGNKTLGYKLDASSYGVSNPIYILGKYETACGGCDGIPTQQMAADRAIEFNKDGHVLMEGLLASAAGPAGCMTISIQATGNAVFAILDTPVDVCIERVKQRRSARGDDRPFNPANTQAKHNQTMRAAKNLHQLGYDVRAIDHTNAYEQVMSIFKEAEA